MTDYFTEQLGDVRSDIKSLKRARVTYRAATVTAVDAVAFTFSADVEGAGVLEGIPGQRPHFLPAVGDEVVLDLTGATPTYRAGRIAEDAVGYTELIPQIATDITDAVADSATAMATADGKNTVTYFTAAPTVSDVGGRVGDTWFRFSSGSLIGTWRWDGSAWQQHTYGDATLGTLTAAKITAGVMSAAVTVSGRFATALTGSRREMNSVGFQAWDSSENLTISLDGTNNLLTGRLRTALTGRRIDIGASGLLGDIRFYSAGAAQTFVRAYTETGGLEAIQFGVESGVHSLWNRINYNSEGWSSYQANRHDFTFTNQSVSGVSTGYFRVIEDNHTSGNDRLRMSIGVNGAFNYYRGTSSTADMSIWEVPAGGETIYRRFWLNDDEVHFTWDYQALGRVVVVKGAESSSTVPGTANISPKLQFVSEQGFGAVLRYAYTAGNGSRLEVRDVNDTAYERIFSAGHVVPSTEKIKENMRNFEGGALEKLRPVQIRRFNRIRSDDLTPADELGFRAEDLPDEMAGGYGEEGLPNSVDLVPTIALLVAAVQELDQRSSREPAT